MRSIDKEKDTEDNTLLNKDSSLDTTDNHVAEHLAEERTDTIANALPDSLNHLFDVPRMRKIVLNPLRSEELRIRSVHRQRIGDVDIVIWITMPTLEADPSVVCIWGGSVCSHPT